MERPIYLLNPYLKEFEATVTRVDRNYVVLDETAFYPNSGGQPFDTGTMERISDHKVFRVVYVGKFGEHISHEVDQTGLDVGDKVFCRIDWDRRYLFMRYHTAAHILSSVINKETGALITGNQIAEDKTRIDFSLEEFNREQIHSFAEKANRIIQEALPIRFHFLSKEDVERDPSLVMLAKGMDPSIKEFRIVEIEGFDRQACGGCHVRNTKEIGRIVIKNIENKGKNNRRVYFTLE
ncbi:MAG: alanyl-tRNA editing protein AlaXM [Candidatus Aenigmatarchaeota archaeon]